MKDYLNFNLDPKKLLPYWLMFMVLFIVPYTSMIYYVRTSQPERIPGLWFFISIFLLILVATALYFFFIKLAIESLEYKEKALTFEGSFGQYMGMILIGLFLSIITIGIYIPWFYKKLAIFYTHKTSYNSDNFKFLGKGLTLFLVVTFSLLVPCILIGIIEGYFGINKTTSSSCEMLTQCIVMIVCIPYMYLVYKWFVNIDFKDYHISWETSFWNSCGKIALELLLILITLGIYFPLAYIRLYKYFVERTVAKSPEKNLRFGYDMEAGKDFLFIWGQMLLCIITLLFYTPWAWSKIGKRFLGKTYLEKEEFA